eukprot:TRINITY_DN11875_c0_g1_i1.p1 TRINITY_DN11875_c0_g1~~TRINITY_DN11875_c0_g1_i1.p1  ORF type:complete len:540 (+),score=32.69 TRINITY_DN11875_c0_g1_i1:278-1897(+)
MSDAAAAADAARISKIMCNRVKALIEKYPWLHSTKSQHTGGPDLQEVSDELEAMLTVMSLVDGPPDVTSLAMQAMIVNAKAHGARQRVEMGGAKKATTAERSARDAVLGNFKQLSRVLDFNEKGEWAFIAPTSKTFRSAYMVSTAATHGLAWVCCTRPFAVVQTPQRVRAAFQGENRIPVAHLKNAGVQLQAGKSVASVGMPLVDSLNEAGVGITFATFQGAVRAHAKNSMLKTLLDRCLHPPGLRAKTIKVMCCEFVRHGRSDASITWIAHQAPDAVREPWLLHCLCALAIVGGHVGTLSFLLVEDGGGLIFGSLPRDPSLQVLQEYHESSKSLCEFRGCFTSTHTIGGRQEILNGLFELAACAGSDVMMQVLSSHGMPLRPGTMLCAAHHHHVRALEWLMENNCPYEPRNVSVTAVFGPGNLEPGSAMQTLKFLRDRLVWNPVNSGWLLQIAIAFRPVHMAKILVALGAPWPEDLGGFMRRADVTTSHPTFTTVVWAIESGCPWGHWTSESCAALNCSDDALEKLHSLGCPCTCVRP